ncbi:hypothetical protein FRB99_008221 [Tulasnella sp. 403]|nr:hypothetical protein FRB99_008221 [Tulasnella sp. 403]
MLKHLLGLIRFGLGIYLRVLVFAGYFEWLFGAALKSLSMQNEPPRPQTPLKQKKASKAATGRKEEKRVKDKPSSVDAPSIKVHPPTDDIPSPPTSSPTGDSAQSTASIPTSQGKAVFRNNIHLEIHVETEPKITRTPTIHELRSHAPCWEHDEIVGPECPTPTSLPAAPHFPVAREIASRVTELYEKFEMHADVPALRRAIHLLDHVVPLFYATNARTRPPGPGDRYVDFLLERDVPEERSTYPRHELLQGLGEASYVRYDWAGNERDLDRAIEAYRESLASMPLHSKMRMQVFNDLGIAMRRKREKMGGGVEKERATVYA